VFFWYRQSSRYSTNLNYDEDISVFRSETLEPGMQAIVLDSEGQLLEFHARPTINLPLNSTAAHYEWNRLFAAAGLNPARFQEMQPELTPTAAFDAQAAWTGSSSETSRGSLRVEAAAYRGRPVFFRVLGPWARPGQPAPLSLGFSLSPCSSVLQWSYQR
jgi:hypothetical protein